MNSEIIEEEEEAEVEVAEEEVVQDQNVVPITKNGNLIIIIQQRKLN